MLLRSDSETAPAYAFRMDLWRLWIRRQHSVWQVMREEGLAIRKPARPWRRVLPVAVGLVGALALIIVPRMMRSPQNTPALLASGPGGFLILEVQPDDAVLRMDGTRVGLGALADRIAAGKHQLEFSAAGFADTALSTQIAEGDTVTLRVALRALIGDLRVETTPPGAEVRIDGHIAGRSPLTARGLALKGTHRVEASRDGFGVARADVSVAANTVTTSALVLEMGTTSMLVTSEPGGGEIRVDGTARGVSPVTLAALPLGRHVFRATREGYNGAETTLVITDATRLLHLAMTREAPGVLVVLGDLPAQIYVDGALVVENVQNSGPRSLPPGNHTVRVILVSGETIDHTVAVRSGERAIYDFSSNNITRRPEGGR